MAPALLAHAGDDNQRIKARKHNQRFRTLLVRRIAIDTSIKNE
jgi:hypothetical protein